MPYQMNPTPSNPECIILADLKSKTDDLLDEDDPLDDIDKGINEDSNVDMYLNLQNIEDIDMSTDSSKRKRCEDGEEVTSQAT